MPRFRVTVCSGEFDIEAKDADEAVDDALTQADYDVEEIEDDEEEEDSEEDDEDDDEAGEHSKEG